VAAKKNNISKRNKGFFYMYRAYFLCLSLEENDIPTQSRFRDKRKRNLFNTLSL
jgi:hypothetical protein